MLMPLITYTNAAGKTASVAADLIATIDPTREDGSTLFLRDGRSILSQDTVAELQSKLDALREASQYLVITDGITAPGAVAGGARIYIDSGTGDLTIVYSDGTVKTIVADT